MSRAVLSVLFVIAMFAVAPCGHATQAVAHESAPWPHEQVPPRDAADQNGQEAETPTATSASGSDLRDALAHVVIERNVITSQRDSLLQQRSLIIGYAVVASLLAMWLLYAYLRRPAAPRSAATDSWTTTATVRRDGKGHPRTNATITIRNSTTQEPEVVERVTTRRLFRTRPAAEATTKVMATPTHLAKPPAPAAPAAAAAATPACAPILPIARPAPARPERRHPEYPPSNMPRSTMRIGSQPSILLSPQVTDGLPEPAKEPETTQARIARRYGQALAKQGLSLLEVMISLAVLATVLTSVSGGIFALSTAQRSANEEAIVNDMMRMWAERIVGADWEWLGRDQLDDPLRAAWSWQRPENAGPPVIGDHPALQEQVADPIHDASILLLADGQSGLSDLRCYLEYYRPVAMELCFMPGEDIHARTLWNEVRPAYRLQPPIDLRQHLDAVVVRLTATWNAHAGGQQRRDLIFARTR